MKKLVFIAAILCVMASYGNKVAGQTMQAANKVSIAQNIQVFQLDSLLKVADQLVYATVIVRGRVTHTCKHSGRRCFIVGEKEGVTMRVEAKGNIGGFNRELVGSELAITGVVKERRLTEEYIAQMEKSANEKKAKEDRSAETCQAELNNIKGMRNWMKANNKGYYSIFYMDGQEYETIDN